MAQGRAGPVSHGNGMDFSQAMFASMADSFKKLATWQGVRWVARYGPRTSQFLKETPSEAYRKMTILSAEEANVLRNRLGLGILLVQWKPPTAATLDVANGKKRGEAMATWARQMGVPPTVHLFCDLEGKATRRVRKSTCMEYVDAWADAVIRRGYRAGLYLAHSLPTGLSTADLDERKGITCFWRSANRAAIPTPGANFAIRQHREQSARLCCVKRLGKPWRVLFKYDLDTLHSSWAKPPIIWY